MNNVEKGGRQLIFAEEMFCPHPLKRLRVDMKRLHPSDHEDARPKKFPKKSLVEDERDEEADQKGVGGEEDNNRVVSGCQNNPVSGDGENNNVQNVDLVN